MDTDESEWELVETLAPEEIERYVNFMPKHVKDMLREGPWPEPFCGVCRALLDMVNKRASGPATVLIDYHDTPFHRGADSSHWREGHEVYARCLEIYRAAGWQGEVQHGWLNVEEAT